MNDVRLSRRPPERDQAGRQPRDAPYARNELGPSQRPGRRRIVRDEDDSHLRVVVPASDQQIGLNLLSAQPLPERGAHDEQLNDGLIHCGPVAVQETCRHR